jgi:NADPH:quinone reductase-like Zn-dependent oxidoreductase
MRAVQAMEFGPPHVLVPSELPEPTAGPGQVVVGVKFAPVLFLDTQIRAGWGRGPRPGARRQRRGRLLTTWPQQVLAAAGGTGPDVVFDGVGGEIGQAAFQITARGGRFAAHGAPSGRFAPIDRQEAARRTITVRGMATRKVFRSGSKTGSKRAALSGYAGRRPAINAAGRATSSHIARQ